MKSKRMLNVFVVLFVASLLAIVGFFNLLTYSKYVSEVGNDVNKGIWDDVDIPFEIANPMVVSSEQELDDAIKNGNPFVQLDDNINGSLTMTGDTLDLLNDLILDLNGQQIACNNPDSMLNIPEGRILTIIDSAGGGGLYNPVGSVLNISGGKLQVYGGKFESGPRPSEYYSYASSNVINGVGAVTPVSGFSSGSVQMPIIIPRIIDGKYDGNVYFDKQYTGGTKTILADTFCYMYIANAALGSDTAVDTSAATFAYSYSLYQNAGGGFSLSGSEQDELKIVIYGYEKTVETAGENENTKYGAIKMESGRLQVNVKGSATAGEVTAAGSFYSYFGKLETACVYFTGGVMDVETTGIFETVNPNELPNGVPAKNGEGSCIICDSSQGNGGGELDVSLATGVSYNGSIIEMKGGKLNISNATFTKRPTKNHATHPETEGSRYDAAIFLADGEMMLDHTKINIEGENIAYTYGILSKSLIGDNNAGARLDCTDVDFTLEGTHSYGIYATHGTINVERGNFILKNNLSCYGVYSVARSSTTPVQIGLKDSTIDIGSKSGYAMYAGNYEPNSSQLIVLSVGVYLNTSETPGARGTVTIDNVTINSVEVGVAMNGGELVFKNGGSITAHNATAVGIRGGNITFENNGTASNPSEYKINCEINRKGTATVGSDGFVANTTAGMTGADNAGKHAYERTVPWLENDTTYENPESWITEKKAYTNADAVYVNGGNLTANGKLTIVHRGLFNEYRNLYSNTQDNYGKLVIKSFAVYVSGGSVDIRYANITNSVGGGVKVASGTATLGAENCKKEDITINTTGTARLNTTYYGAASEGAATWQFWPNLSGGYAITARGGNLNVYNGTFISNYASGVLATGGGTINIYDGEFEGRMAGTENNTTTSIGGPATHYGIKVTGAATVRIYGGSFNGRNGGAVFIGDGPSARAVIYVYKGEFSTVSGNGLRAQDGINVFDYTTLYLGAYTQKELADQGLITVNSSGTVSATAQQQAQLQGLITIKGNLFPISLNPIRLSTSDNRFDNDVIVNVYYGNYIPTDTGTGYGTGSIDARMCATFNIYGIGKSTSAKKLTLSSSPSNGHYVRCNNSTAYKAPTRSYSENYFFFVGPN